MISAAAVVVLSAHSAHADITVRGGVGLGAMQVIASQRLAITPHVTLDWSPAEDAALTIGVRNELALLPPMLGGRDKGVSVHDRTGILFGLGVRRFTGSLGPTLVVYSMSACSPVLCAWTSGIAVGGEGQVTLWTTETLGGVLGIQIDASIGWYDGSSAVVRRSVLGTLTAGPVFRIGHGR
jgi:hypothetical protein